MALADGNEVGGGSSGNAGVTGGVESVDIGSHINEANASAGSGSAGSGSGKRIRRTRAQLEADGYYNGQDSKPASTGKPVTKARGALDVNSIQFALTGIHSLLAVAMSAPELALSDTEAETVAKNLVAVGRHYDLQQTAKATDWSNLVISLGVVYGGRIMSVGIRKKAEKATRRAAGVGGFKPTPPMTAPQQPVTTTPPKSPTMGVETRARTREDDALLNEHEVFLVP